MGEIHILCPFRVSLSCYPPSGNLTTPPHPIPECKPPVPIHKLLVTTEVAHIPIIHDIAMAMAMTMVVQVQISKVADRDLLGLCGKHVGVAIPGVDMEIILRVDLDLLKAVAANEDLGHIGIFGGVIGYVDAVGCKRSWSWSSGLSTIRESAKRKEKRQEKQRVASVYICLKRTAAASEAMPKHAYPKAQ